MFSIGLSSYSLSRAINDGRMDVLKAMEFAAEHGAQNFEIVPCGSLQVNGNDELIAQIKAKAAELGLTLSSYTVYGCFTADPSREAFEAEVARLKTEIDTAAKLGVTRMRHDIGYVAREEANYTSFEKYLPVVVEACGILADYAAQFGITTSIENHGYLFQGSERVQRIILAVGRDNFRTTMDVGNFLCADEDPEIAVMTNLPFASMIHFKDFYVRKSVPAADGYFPSRNGRWLRGSVTGEGDVDLASVVARIKESGYDGFISIEYEGAEDPLTAVPRCIRNVRALFGLE